MIGSRGFPLDDERIRELAAADLRARPPRGRHGPPARGDHGLGRPHRAAALRLGADHRHPRPRRPARALPRRPRHRPAIPGARLIAIPGMGHDLPREVWPQVVDAVVETAGRAAPAARVGRRRSAGTAAYPGKAARTREWALVDAVNVAASGPHSLGPAASAAAASVSRQRERLGVQRVLGQLETAPRTRPAPRRGRSSRPRGLLGHGAHRGRVPVERRAPRRPGSSTRRTAAASSTTITVPTCAPPEITRCPMPASLRCAAGVDAPAARAVLARHLAHARVDPEPPQRAGDQLGGRLEARVDARARIRVGHGVGELERALVEHRRAAAGQPQHRAEARGAGRRHGASA